MFFQNNVFIIFISLFSASVSADQCSVDVKLSLSLQNNGFHRNITYLLDFGNEEEFWLNQNCMIAMDQTLPPGVYADPDELGELRRNSDVNVLPKNRVNVELPAEESESTTVYVIGLASQRKVELWFPAHARYHKAVTGGGIAKNVINPPIVYLRCPDQRLDKCGQPVSASTMLLCGGQARNNCRWREMPFKLMTPTVAWLVPLGNLDHYYSVAFGTTMACISGSMYLLRIVHEFKLNKKRK